MPITAIAFLLIFALGCFATIFKRPVYGLYLYFFVFYLHPPGKYWGAYLPDFRWTFFAAILTFLSLLVREKNKGLWLKPMQSKLLVLFLLFIIAQAPFVLGSDFHSEYVILYAKMVMLFFIIVTLVNTEKELFGVVLVNLLGCAYMGWLGYTQHTSGRFESVGAPALSGANLMGMHVAAVLTASSFYLVGLSSKYRFGLLIPIAFALNLIFLTQSRGALLSLVCAGVFIFIFKPKDMKKVLYFYGLGALVAGSLLIGPQFIQRIEGVTQAKSSDDMEKSAYSRVVIIESQIEMFKESPIVGYGHRGTLILSPLYVPETYMTDPDGKGERRSSHNLTMSLLVDHGVIGLAIYYLMVMRCIFLVKNVRRYDTSLSIRSALFGLISGLVCFMVASQFSSSKVLELDIWLMALITTIEIKFLSNVNKKTGKELSA